MGGLSLRRASLGLRRLGASDPWNPLLSGLAHHFDLASRREGAGAAPAYRPEIDGLRAIAVIPVVLFHLGLGWLPGGFVGVDVFFVISGYLITRLLLAESAAGPVSLLRFYERRVRRIAPNLVAMLAFTTLAAMIILIPFDLLRFAQSLIAAIGSGSNVLFWLRTGYFEPDSASFPLLHTWSLGVEEQYYLCFPLLVIATARRPVLFVALLGGSWLASLAIAEWQLAIAPSAAFYLPFARWWELMTGSLIAALPLARGDGSRNALPGWVALLAPAGLAAIALAVLVLDAHSRFPGLAALVPCCGTAAVIVGEGLAPGPVGRLLASAALRTIGLASFALYLWHWPVIVFARYVLQRDLAPAEIGAALALIAVLGFASWRWIEVPARRVPLARLGPALALAATALVAFAALAIATRGLPQRYPPALRPLALGTEATNPARAGCDSPTPERIAADGVCVIGAAGRAPRFAVVGDSFADALVPGFAAAATRAGLAGRVYSFAGCAVLAGAGNNRACRAHAQAALARLAADRSIARVVLVERWTTLFEGRREGALPHAPVWLSDDATTATGAANNRRVLAQALQRTLALLGPDRVVVVFGMPEPHVAVPQFATLRAVAGLPVPGLPLARYRARQAGVAALLRAETARSGAHLLDLGSAMCGRVECPVIAGTTPLYSDDNHPTRDFAVALAPALARAIAP